MNKIVLTCAAVALALNANAQDFSAPTPAVLGQSESELFQSFGANKTTALTDTLYFANSGQTDPSTYSASFYDRVTPVDSGRFFGHNKFGFKGFAQLYRFNAAIDRAAPVDTTYYILGLYAAFGGTGTSTTKSVTLNIWKRDAVKYLITGRPKFAIYGAPLSTAVASMNVTFANLRTGNVVPHYFPNPIVDVNYDIYAGVTLPSYTYTALGGDTLGLFTSANTNGGSLNSIDASGDTLVNVNTLIMNSSNQWKSAGFDPALSRSGDLVLFPIIKLHCKSCTGGGNALSVTGFTQNDLQFFGNYPNPATGYTNVKFALKSTADVTVLVSDITGKTVQTIKQSNLGTGEHTIRIETGNLAAGTYSYLVVTSKNDGVGSQFTIAK